MSLERLRDRAQSFTEDISRETYLAYSGLKPEAALQAVYERHADVLSDDTLAECIERFRDAAAGSEDARAARMMLEWQVESRVARQLAALDEREVALENKVMIRLADSSVIPYQRAAIDIANSRDVAERRALDTARVRAVEESFGIAAGYNATFEALSGISLTALAAECEAFIHDTDAMWYSVLTERLRA